MSRRAIRATYHHGALRETLLKHAIALLDKEGVEAVTIRAVARNAGVTHAAPVNHFATRGALLTVMATQFFTTLGQTIDERLADRKASGPARVRAYAEALVAFALRYPNRYRLMWRRDLLHEDAELQRAMDAIYDRLIEDLSKERNAARKSVHTVAIAMWSMSHGYAAMRLDGNFEDRRDEVTGRPRFAAMLDLVLG